MQEIYFWKERFDTYTWHMGYCSYYGNGFQHYTTIASFTDTSLSAAFGTKLLTMLHDKWRSNPVGVKMGWMKL